MQQWMTVPEVAKMLQISEQSLYAAVRAGQIPAIHVGKRVRFDPEALREWVAKANEGVAKA
jgi:excisionase family DNA binding protein